MHCTKIISRVCAAALSFILLLQAFPVSAINQAEADTSAALLELLSSGEEVFLTDDGEMLLEEEEMEEPSESYLSEDAPNAPQDDPDEEPLYEESALDLIPSGGKGPSVDLLDSELYATLSGKVVDEDGKGLSNVCVSLYDYGYEEIVALCYTDENGTWSTSSAVQGNEYHLRFHSPYFSFPLEGLVCKASGAAVTVETMTGTETYDPETPVSPAEDFSYTVLNATGISITGYLGTDVHVVIPETIDGYIVQAIDASAFSGNKALEAVILPAQVTTIGSSAFYGCNSLSYVGFNDKLTVIGSSAFYGCSALEDLDLPNTLQEIQNHAFYQCSFVSTLSMPMTLVGINGYAFAGCTGLKLVQIPDSVLGLGYRAFYQCTALETVTLPTEWTTCLAYSPNASVYYGHIFEGCSALSSLIVPETIVTLPDYALSGCSSLEEVLLPQSLKTIGMRAFYNCDSLTSIVFPNSLNTVKQSAFQNCDSLSEVIFNASLKRLDAFAFAQCPSLSSAMLPDSVEALGYQLFCDDTALTEVHIPTGWTSCPAYSQGAFTGYGHIFDNCSALTSVMVSDGVTSLPDYAFQGCAELEEILLPESLQALPDYGFDGCSSLKQIVIPSNVETIGAYALRGCTGLSALTIPDQVTSLGAGALEGCNALTEVSLSSSLTKIDRLAFSGCTGLTEIALPDSVESMGYQAFLNCTALQSINIPMSWNSCPAYSYGAFTGYSHIFEGCTALKSITVPEGFTQLPEYAFHGCNLLESIILPEGLESIPAHAFNGCSSLKSISLPQSVTAIGDYALRACSSLTELVIPNKVTSLGISAVENCSGLSEITLSSSLSSIGRLALAGCTGLTELSIPNSVTSIGYRAFYNCSRLKDVTLSSGWNECPVYSHGAGRYYGHIFEGCTELVRLDLPEGIVNLPAGALSYSPSLRTVTLPSTLVAIRDNAFKNCSALRGVWVDSGVDTISDSAFAGCSNLTIHGNQGSFAQTFATARDIPFSTLPLSGDTDITLSGTVKDANGNALSGVSIMLYDISERYVFASVTTLEDGSWSIPNVTTGHDYRVRCHSANAVFDDQVTLNALYSSTEMNFTAKKTVSDTESAGSDFTYKVTSGSFIQITGYTGSDTALVIPAVIDGYTVDSIAASVFKGNTTLTSVILPDTLTVIHESAFQNCTALAYVGFGSGLKTIYRSAFRGCSALSEVSLSNGVTYLEHWVFADCPALTSVSLPDTLASLGYQIFLNDTALTEINIPVGWNSCPSYSYGAFTGYSHLFENCTSLTSITIPEGLVVLPAHALDGCAQLQNVYLPSTLTTIGVSAFNRCTALTGITFPEKLETIYESAFLGCTSFTSLHFPASLRTIYNFAFDACSGLTSITMDEGLDSLGAYAFRNCPALQKVQLADSITKLGHRAFQNCTALTEINIPVSWTTCPAYSQGAYTGYGAAFQGCTALKSVTVPEGIAALPAYAFSNCESLEHIYLPQHLTVIPNDVFRNCASLKEITIPEPVTTIQNYAFAGCTSLVTLTVPNNVTSVGVSAFENCSGLKNITLSENLTFIDRLAFSGCTGLTELALPNSVSSIGYRAFYNCSRLSKVSLPTGWTACPVYSHGAARDYGCVFEGCSALTRVEIPDGAAVIPSYAFRASPSLRTVILPNSVSEIGANAFLNCGNLEVLWIDQGTTKIDATAMNGCSKLTIHGYTGTYAESYANTYNIPFAAGSLDHYFLGLGGQILTETGAGAAGISVGIYRVEETTAVAMCTTDAQGNWSFEEAEEGMTYVIRFYSPYYSIAEDRVRVLMTGTSMMLPTMQAVSRGISSVESAASDFTYQITSGSFIQITGYTGSDTALVIPSVINGYTVDSIAASVFKGNTTLTSVILPDTLTVIHESAFQNCTALAYVGFGSGLKTIYRSAFRGCSALSEVSLSNGVTYLEHWVFADCPALTSVSLPDTLASLGYQIFLNDTALTEINIPVGWNSCPSYSYGAFTGYSHLFENCTSLTSITIPEGLVVLPAHALDGCAQLQNVYLPSSLTTIGVSALNRCTALTGITFPEKLETIYESAFLGCTSFTSLHFPASLRTIYNFAFDACSGLTSITMDEGLDSLGAYAFRNCPALQKVQLADSITKLGHRAFQNCTALTEINIPVSWTTCPAYSQGAYTGYGAAFQGCTALKSVTVPEGIAALPAYAFANCESLEHIYLPEGIPDIPHHAFYKCTALKELKIPDTVESIGEAAIEGCTSLSSLVFPAGVHTLDCYALKNCSGLTSLTLSTDLETIGYFAMEGCSNLSSLVLPNKVSAIGYRAFYNCSRLSDIVLPSGWTRCITYSYGAFDGYGNIFDGCTSLTRLDVPDGVTTIPAYAFAGNTNLITVTLPDSIATIGNQAFNGCTNLGGVDLGNVHTIGDYAFQNCSTLEDLILSDDLRTIGKNAFKGCSALTIPNIPPRVTSIGEYAFYGTLLQDITIPSGVNSLNQYSFASCPDLNKVTIRRNVTSIHANAFKDSPNLYIICYNGSAAHTFAVNNNIPYELLPEPTPAGSDVDNGKAVPLTGTDAKGNPVNTRLFIYEYGTLDSLEGVTYSYEMGTLSMERDGYHSVNIPDCTLTMSKKVKVAMIPDSHKGNIFAVHCEGKDALANKVSIQKDSGLFSVNVYTDLPSSEIDVYQLMQDGSVLATSINGSFGLDAKKVIVDKEITARIILKDGTKCEKVKTNIVVMEKVPEWDGELSIGEKISFKIPKKVPLLGGGTFDVDFSVLPVNFTIKENNFRVGIGCTVDLLENEAQFASFRKFIESQQESIRTGLNGLSQVGRGVVTAGGKKGFDMEVFGYAEGTWTNSGDIQTVSGNIMIEITGSYKQEWQTMVVVVPVVLKLKLEAGTEALLGLGFDFENAQFFFNGKLSLTLPEITVSGGVGVAYIADISAYGSGKNEIEYSTELGSITATLSGEAGVSAKLLFASYKKALWKDDWVYYRVGEATPSLMDDMELLSLEEGDFQVDRSYVARQSEWLASEADAELMAATGVSTSQTLQTSIFYSAEPQLIVTDDGTKVLFWTGDDPERETGTNTAAMYSVYDSTAKTWSVPTIIEDDKSADFQLSAATDGEKIYLVWLDSSRKDLTADSTISEIAAANGISAAVYDPAEGTFNVTNVKDACCAMLPRITVINGTPYIAWLENSSNDALTLTGTNTVCYAAFDGNRWNAKVFSALSKPVISLAAGALNGQAAIAYTVDGDGDLANTLEDIELYAGAAGSAAKKITSNSVPEQNPQFAKVGGEDKLVWFADGSLFTTASFTGGTAMTGCDDISADYRVVSWQDETILLCAVGRSNSTQLQLYTLSDSVISKPVSLYNGDRYLSSFSVAQDGSNLLLPYTQVYANITSESIHETTDLCLMTVVPTYDLRLDSVTAAPSSIVGGGNLTAELKVTNTGTLPITQVTVTSTKLNVSSALNLLPGESGTVTVSLPLNAVITSNAAYTFKAIVKNESNTADNTQTLVIGYADLSVQAEAARSAGMEKVLLTVDNLGCVDTLTTLRVRRNNESGEILKELHLGTLAAHSSEIFELDSTLVPEIGQQEQTLHFEVFAVANEEYYSNNTSFVYLTGGTPELAVDVTVNGTSYKVDTGLTGSCLTYAAVYDTNGKMLTATGMSRLSSDSTAELTATVENLPDTYEIRLFFLDDAYCPILDMVIIPSK